jgi:CheY-like chemotaxis protein
MDHMMPEMDGIEATHAIRAMRAEYCQTMPVIALTANAVSGMREMFLKNGFNDFLPKPIEAAKLDAVLKKWIPAKKHHSVSERDQKNPEPAACPETAFPAIEGVDVAAGIARVGGSRRHYLELLAAFRKDAEAGSALLAQVPDTASLSPFVTLVHGLKSALANIGANDLSQTAALLEKSALRSDMSVIRGNLASFREQLAALTERIAGDVPYEMKNADGAGETRRKNSTIMVVDDNIVNLKIAQIALSESYDVCTAASAAKMFDMLEQKKPEKPALILLDVAMPEMNGYEAIKILKATPDTRDIAVIFLTGMSSPEDERNGLSLGAVDYISKPFMPQLLRQKVGLHLASAARK